MTSVDRISLGLILIGLFALITINAFRIKWLEERIDKIVSGDAKRSAKGNGD